MRALVLQTTLEQESKSLRDQVDELEQRLRHAERTACEVAIDHSCQLAGQSLEQLAAVFA